MCPLVLQLEGPPPAAAESELVELRAALVSLFLLGWAGQLRLAWRSGARELAASDALRRLVTEVQEQLRGARVDARIDLLEGVLPA